MWNTRKGEIIAEKDDHTAYHLAKDNQKTREMKGGERLPINVGRR